jgi:UDP-N-acetyl-D-glucosamine dehydrogenase
MDIAQELVGKAQRREALFGIVGLGYVGLPLAVELAKAGYRVLGFDISERVVNGLNAGHSHVKDISDGQLREALEADRFEATTDMTRMGEPDAVSISCPRRSPSSRIPTSASSWPRPSR